MIRPHINRLMDSDVLGWCEDPPAWFIRFTRGRQPWIRKLSNINGLHIRIGRFGLVFHFGSGVYCCVVNRWKRKDIGPPYTCWCGPFKACIYYQDEYQRWLESWCGY